MNQRQKEEYLREYAILKSQGKWDGLVNTGP